MRFHYRHAEAVEKDVQSLTVPAHSPVAAVGCHARVLVIGVSVSEKVQTFAKYVP